ncbi:hypothetical protein SO802_015325, partial [Lithocarpus litseifolius]
VDMPLDKPIRRGALVLNLEGDTVWVAFQYERLLGLCFRCGLLGHEAKVCSGSGVKEGEELPYGDWLRVGSQRQRELSRKEAPSPPRRKQMDHQPLRTTDLPVVAPSRSVTCVERDNNEGVTDSIMALNAQHGHCMIKQTIMEDINPNIIEGITPRVMREINLDNNELSNGKELNRKEKNVELQVEEFITVPITYVGNMGNLGNNSQSETLASHKFEGQ